MICEIPTLPRQTISWMGFWNRKPIKFLPYITKTACFNSLYNTIPSPGDKHIHMWYTQPMRWRCVAHHFRVKKSKAKVTRVVRIFCRVRSVAPSLFDQFTSYVKHTHTTHEVTMCRSRFPGHRSRSHGSFEIFAMSAPWLRPYLTHKRWVEHTHNPWGDDVAHIIFGSKGQRSRSIGSFEVFTVSAPWLRPYLTYSLHMWYIHSQWGDDVSRIISGSEGQRSRLHGSFEIPAVSTRWF